MHLKRSFNNIITCCTYSNYIYFTPIMPTAIIYTGVLVLCAYDPLCFLGCAPHVKIETEMILRMILFFRCVRLVGGVSWVVACCGSVESKTTFARHWPTSVGGVKTTHKPHYTGTYLL